METRQLGNTDMHVRGPDFGGSEIHDEQAAYETIERLLNTALDDGFHVMETMDGKISPINRKEGECYGFRTDTESGAGDSRQ
jgi:hypothetical protein